LHDLVSIELDSYRMIYFDNNATTPVDQRVLDAMLPYFTMDYGNAASRQHQLGRNGESAVARTRETLADILGVEPGEIVFTSGATEACNLAIKGIFGMYRRKGRHIVVINTEHKAVLDCCSYLEEKGAEVTYLDVDSNGMIDLQKLGETIREDTILVIAMWANNETGVVHRVEDIGNVCARKGTLFFSDATQAVGKILVRPREAGIQLLALSSHKFYGPKGVGALFVSGKSPRIKLDPLIHGGGHERGNRSGTLNVPGIVGMGKAVEIAWDEHKRENERLRGLRDILERGLLSIDRTESNSNGSMRMPHVSNIRIDGIDAEKLMDSLQNILAVASGSACTAADPDPSHVLMAMGLSREEAKTSLRFSLGRMNTEEEVHRVIEILTEEVALLRLSL
jgi:cysteine desulfurase